MVFKHLVFHGGQAFQWHPQRLLRVVAAHDGWKRGIAQVEIVPVGNGATALAAARVVEHLDRTQGSAQRGFVQGAGGFFRQFPQSVLPQRVAWIQPAPGCSP